MRTHSTSAMRTALPLCVFAACAATASAGTWVSHNDGLRSLTVNGITVAPSDPDTIYIQTRALGTYKSIDAGATWSKTATFNSDKGPGYDHLVHQGPAVHPTDADTVWVASGGKVYKTTTVGGSWVLSSTGTTVNNCNGIHGIVINPNNPDHLFAGTIIAGCEGGVFESTDGGANWTNIAGSNVSGSGVGNDAWPIALDGTNPNRLYCGSPHNSVYRSINGANNWINSPPVWGDNSSYEVVINPLDPAEIWCSEVGGTWNSNNYGVDWTRRTDLFNDDSITALRFAPSNANVAYAIVGNTIWRSNNNGATFTALTTVLGGPRCIEIHPADTETVYVGTAGLGMAKSIDGGLTFTEINTGLPMTSLIRGWQAFGDPLDPGSMYCILDGNLLYHLPSGETDWQYYAVLPGNNLPYLQISRHQPDHWYFIGGGLWRSTDSGLTWDEVYTNGAATSVYDYWLDPRRCGRILVGDRDGHRVVLSEDAGDTWTTLSGVPDFDGYVSGITGDPFNEDNILVAASPLYHSGGQNGYIWRSSDRGQSWQHIRDRMFYGDWRTGNGYWKLTNYAMRQEQTCCGGYHVNLDHATFGNGTYECKIRIIDSNAGNTDYWAGFGIRFANPDDYFTDSGWLVYMRRNGVVALHNHFDGTVINAAQVASVTDTSQWNTIKLVASGNVFDLYANDTLVGSYTDTNNRYNAPGYFAFMTNKTYAEFDDLDIQAETAYTDTFDQAVQFGAYWGRFVAADPHTPGRFAYATQWGGLWYTTDTSATWQRISPDSRNGYIYYRPLFSTLRAGNLFANSGSGYSWRIDNYYDDAAARQQIGQNLSYSTWLVTEDPTDLNRLYSTIYNLGISIYDDSDIIGTPASSIPVAIDYDGDGDIDQADFGHMQECLSGPGITQYDPFCFDAMLDADEDVDDDDISLFFDCMVGPNIEPNPACDCFGP